MKGDAKGQSMLLQPFTCCTERKEETFVTHNTQQEMIWTQKSVRNNVLEKVHVISERCTSSNFYHKNIQCVLASIHALKSSARPKHHSTVTRSKHQCHSNTETLQQQNKNTIHSRQIRLSHHGQSTCLIPAPARCSALAFWRLKLNYSCSVSPKAPPLCFCWRVLKVQETNTWLERGDDKGCISYGYVWMLAVGRFEYADISLRAANPHQAFLFTGIHQSTTPSVPSLRPAEITPHPWLITSSILLSF